MLMARQTEPLAQFVWLINNQAQRESKICIVNKL